MKILVVLLLAGFIAGCMSLESLKAGSGTWYEGMGQGLRGHISVSVHYEEGRIADIIADHAEDEWVGGDAIQELIDQVLDTQSIEVDAISGATESSAGFLAALEEALNKIR
ncbi:hypothetical protein FACS1894172_03400 [Spirochaetia bacterium]|nr:hypothetical protein FACS1894164_13640 [Spirochaetia bacterium]GHU30334.1 hypothetical protein FACS1894172_03400 [Spirochaetia bacterium]